MRLLKFKFKTAISLLTVVLSAWLFARPAALGAEEREQAPAVKSPASRADTEDEQTGTDAQADKEKTEKKSHVDLTEIEILGEIDRPKVFFIIPRAGSILDKAHLDRDFSDEILEPVIKHVFERESFIILRPLR